MSNSEKSKNIIELSFPNEIYFYPDTLKFSIKNSSAQSQKFYIRLYAIYYHKRNSVSNRTLLKWDLLDSNNHQTYSKVKLRDILPHQTIPKMAQITSLLNPEILKGFDKIELLFEVYVFDGKKKTLISNKHYEYILRLQTLN